MGRVVIGGTHTSNAGQRTKNQTVIKGKIKNCVLCACPLGRGKDRRRNGKNQQCEKKLETLQPGTKEVGEKGGNLPKKKNKNPQTTEHFDQANASFEKGKGGVEDKKDELQQDGNFKTTNTFM